MRKKEFNFEDAWDAGEMWANDINNGTPSIGTTHSLELTLRQIWEADRSAFIEGARWMFNKMKKVRRTNALRVEGEEK